MRVRVVIYDLFRLFVCIQHDEAEAEADEKGENTKVPQHLIVEQEMFEVLKTESFNVAFSGLLGLALVMLFYPKCKDDCRVVKAPPVEEIRSSTYQLGDRCYKFVAKPTSCTTPGAGGAALQPIEAFGVIDRF